MPTLKSPVLHIVIYYIFFGSFWITFSDSFLVYVFDSPRVIYYYQTVKGFVFVLVTSVFLFYVIRAYFDKFQESKRELDLVSGYSPSVNYKLKILEKGYTPVWISKNVERILGYSVEEALHEGWWFSNIHPSDVQKVVRMSSELEKNRKLIHEYRFRHKDSSYLWIRDELYIRGGDDAEFIYGCWSNITKERQGEDLHLFNDVVLNDINSSVLVFDCNGFIVSANNSFINTFGFNYDDINGKRINDIAGRMLDYDTFNVVSKQLEENRYWKGEAEVYSNSGTRNICHISIGEFYSKIDAATKYYAVLTDLSEIKEKDEALQRLIYFDELTGIPSRASLLVELNKKIEVAKVFGEKFALLAIGLDRFKLINESLGHDSGDIVLGVVASRLALRCSDQNASLYRFAGDEFIIILNHYNSISDINKFALSLRECIGIPIVLDDHENISVSVSIGISTYPNDGTSRSELLSNAGVAMSNSKLNIGQFFSFYDSEMTLQVKESLNLEYELSRAIKKDEFMLVYQPVIDPENERIVGGEALIRWLHPKKGLISPIHFIPVAEDTGLIVDIGEWVIDNTIKQIREWIDIGINPGVIAINIASKQIDMKLFKLISCCLEKYKVPASSIELELTESSLVGADEEVILTLDSLRELGVKLAIDDFGTGYSSLSYLTAYSIDKLKIDRSFIRYIEDNSRSRELVKAIISMAHALSLEVQAEGIETEWQRDYITSSGCEYLQGYLFAKPVTADLFAQALKTQILPK